jgi:hypothetical protein
MRCCVAVGLCTALYVPTGFEKGVKADVCGPGIPAPEATSNSKPMADHTVPVEKAWGTVVFYRGFPRHLVLRLGSGADLLSGFSRPEEFGAVQVQQEGVVYSTFHDTEMTLEERDDQWLFEGQLRDAAGALGKNAVSYSLTWTVSDLGYLKFDVRLQSHKRLAPGSVSYRFPFNGANLNRYYYTGFQPKAVRDDSSLKRLPLDDISSPGTILHFESDVIHRILGFIRSESETLNFVPGEGFFREVLVTNSPPAVVTYVDDTPPSLAEVRASFYLLPAPVREHESLRRVFAAYFTKDRPLEAPGGVQSFLDTLSSYGIKDFIYHTWRSWNFTDPTTDVSCLASDPVRLKSLIHEAHARDIRVILYINLIPEEKKTVWYRKENAGKWRTEHPFSVNMVGAESQRRDLMDLNSPFFEHRLRDIDYALDTMGADGVFVDWFTAFGCTRPHAGNHGIPRNNINRLIELISYVHGKGKLIYLHSSEESRIPFLENLADRYATGERSWDRVTSFSTARGIFDRWTASAGNMGVILDSRMAVSDAELREEVNWALLEGLNPFGYTYLVKWYALGPNVRQQIASGAVESSFQFHDTYPLTLLAALAPYDLESMTFLPAKQAPAQSDNPHVGVSVASGNNAHILFVVNTDMLSNHTAQLRCNRSKLGIRLEKDYRVAELTTGRSVSNISGETLAGDGLSLEVPPNTCQLVAIEEQ